MRTGSEGNGEQWIRLQDAVIHGPCSLQVLKEDDAMFIVPRSDELQRRRVVSFSQPSELIGRISTIRRR